MKIKQTFKKVFKSKILTGLLLLAIIVTVVATISYKNNNAAADSIEKEEIKKVVTEIVAPNNQKKESIKIVGKALSANSVDVVALTQGTLEGIFFELGEKVSKNQTLAFLSNGMTSTNMQTAQSSYLSMVSNLDIARRSADEQVRQAEVGVQNALESVRLAEISLSSAEANYKNSGQIQIKNNQDTKEKAIIACDDYLNFAKNILDNVNYIIGEDSGEQLDGIANTLAVKNSTTLNRAKSDYYLAKTKYSSLKSVKVTSDNVLTYLKSVSDLMVLVNQTVYDTVIVLDNTIANNSFSEATLMSQRSIYKDILSSVVGTQSRIQSSLSSLENLDLNDDKLWDSLKTAVDSSKSQLEMAKVAYDNSLINLERAKQGREQQILSAQMSIDSSLGQLNLTREQFSDLTLKAPIEGQITKKGVDLGTEVNSGQMIAQISQTGQVKVEINLSSDDVYLVKTGQKVLINNQHEAKIDFISPVADEVTRKVRAEINIDNEDNKLVPGTTVDVEIFLQSDDLGEVSDDSFFIPLRALNVNQIENFVFVVVDGKAVKTEVEIGEQRGASIEIISGLSNKDVLVVDGGKSLKDGDTVEEKT